MTNNQFDLWGLSREWRRNFIATCFAILCLSITYLKLDGDKRESRLIEHNLELQRQLLECEQKTAATIERLQREKFAFVTETMNEMREVNKQVQALEKKIKR